MRSSFLNTLTPTEKQAAYSSAALTSLRLLGLFLVIPVLSPYAAQLPGATPILIGIALGCYGLTQAILQIPFGLWSDTRGRRPVIILGLILFCIGSLIAAYAQSIEGLIIGRSLQGAAAIGSATNALLTDCVRADQRTHAMALTGMAIGLSFCLAMFLGPWLAPYFGVSRLFLLSALLGALGLFALSRFPQTAQQTTKLNIRDLKSIVQNRSLIPLNLSILLLHAIFTATFVALPLALSTLTHTTWMIYLPSLILAFIAIPPLLKQQHRIFILIIFILAISQLCFSLKSLLSLALGLWLFFTAFTFLEAFIPSKLSQLVPAETRGTALGINACYQFLGIFLGGLLGGLLYHKFHLTGVFIANILLCVIWMLIARTSLTA